jgi:lipid-A-disaccharide synthase
MPMPKTFFFVAGEPSGDLHGSKFIQALAKLSPGSKFYGIGGPKMRSCGLVVDPIPTESLLVMGISAVLKNLPRLFRSFFRVKRAILQTQPDCVILIDYPGFNLRLLRSLRKAGFDKKIVYAIAPSVWAHGKSRAELLKRYADLLLVIYPFEVDYFKEMPCYYIGNPLSEDLLEVEATQRSGIALFPGSRKSEIELNLPIMLKSLEELFVKRPKAFAGKPISISVANERTRVLIQKHIKTSVLPVQLVETDDTKKLMHTCALYLATSGTVTLELALAKARAVVIYKIPNLVYVIGKYIARIKLKFFCIVNILLNREVYKEFFSPKIHANSVANALLELYDSQKMQSKIDRDLEELLILIGQSDPSLKAAGHIIDLLDTKKRSNDVSAFNEKLSAY